MSTAITMELEIPGELITEDSKEIQYGRLDNKILIGLCGYKRSGKDTLGKMMIDRLGFKRIAFADMLKKDMNEHMKSAIFNDLQEKGINIEFESIDFENPSNIQIKEILRPYMIWFGEEMKRLNGLHHWTNRALSQIGQEDRKIILTDVRRSNELTLFKKSRRFIEKCQNNRRVIDMPKDSPYDEEVYDLNFETLFLYVNQLENRDDDVLTKQTIIEAFENFMFDDIVEVDSRIKGQEYQEKHILHHLRELTLKYPHYFI